jgi:hypothetical protein
MTDLQILAIFATALMIAFGYLELVDRVRE